MRLPAVAVAAVLVFAGGAAGGPAPQGELAFEAFTTVGGNQIAVYRERADGTARARVSRGRVDYQLPTWSPSGRQIAAVGGTGLAIFGTGGQIDRRIPIEGDVWDPGWSPDGRRIAYLVQHCFDPAGHEDAACATLWAVGANGGARVRLSQEDAVDTTQALASVYSWSPDGTQIAYLANARIDVVDVATGKTITVARGPVGNPAWSPNGRLILFPKQRGPFEDSDLYVVSPNGGGLHRLARTLGAYDPRWSPDGSRIAYVRFGAPGASTYAVYVARADGSQPLEVGKAYDPDVLVWSPDSSLLLVTGKAADSYRLLPADGRGSARQIRGGDATAEWHA